MASAPSDQGPVSGRVDRDGRLTSADPPLLRLQEEAGAGLGSPLALPQLASIVRSAMKLGVPLSRAVLAASSDQDIDLWVRAEPDADGAALTIEQWTARSPAPPRLTLVGSEPEDEPDGLTGLPGFTIDAELKITTFDAPLAERLGLVPGAVIGEPLTRRFQLTEEGDAEMPLLTALASRQPFHGQRARLRGNGEAALVLDGTALADEQGGFSGYEIKVQLAGGGTGQAGPLFDPALDEALRSPLDRIIAAAERIVDRSEGPLRSDYAAYAGDIAAAGRHLLSVIRSMTDQAGAGKEGSVDLSGAVRDALQLVEAQAEERSVHVELVDSADKIIAAGEIRGIVQILVNLLGNAVRHSPDGGTVAVILERRGSEAVVTIADEGPGIAEPDQQRIFERYERLADTPGGSGLGLAISRRLARSMGGDIELTSAPGHGARFALVLPAA